MGIIIFFSTIGIGVLVIYLFGKAKKIYDKKVSRGDFTRFKIEVNDEGRYELRKNIHPIFGSWSWETSSKSLEDIERRLIREVQSVEQRRQEELQKEKDTKEHQRKLDKKYKNISARTVKKEHPDMFI